MSSIRSLLFAATTCLVVACGSASRVPIGGHPSGTTEGESSGSQCTYPAGPYGNTEGATVDPSLSWQGYRRGATSPSTIRATDFYDCDGSKDIAAIIATPAGITCGACVRAAQNFAQFDAAWTARGIELITLMQEGTLNAAAQWQASLGVHDSAVVADPLHVFSNNNPVPVSMIINPRTMQITYYRAGWEITLDEQGAQVYVVPRRVDQMARDNGAP